MTKTCSMCHEDKETTEFYRHESCKHGVSNICKECDKRKKRAYTKGDPVIRCLPKNGVSTTPYINRYAMRCDSIIEGEKFCSICNTSKQLQNFAKDSKTHKHRIVCKACSSRKYRGRYNYYSKEKYERNKEKIKEARKLYQKTNRHKMNLANKRPWVRVSRQIGKRMRDIFKAKSISCIHKAPFSIKQLKAHIESKMRVGMSWDNYGQWSIDHIKPICLWDIRDFDQRMLMNGLNNLQCLWVKENEYKGKSYDPDHPMGWHGLDKFLIERGEPTPWLVG